MLIAWVELQSYHVVWRVNNKARVEQELFDIEKSG